MNPSANSPTSDCTPPADPGSAAVVAHAAESSSGACTPTLEQPSLPVDVPESETLWLFLTKGYSLNYIRESLVCGIPHVEAEARMLRDRARKTWAQIRAEVCA